MPLSIPLIPIGIYGHDRANPNTKHGCGLWQAGCAAAVTTAGGQPTLIDPDRTDAGSWDELLDGQQGAILVGNDASDPHQLSEGASLCEWCRRHHFPLLAIDHGLHILNQTCGGNLYQDLSRELPEALQHRHPPEKGVRHAIMVEPNTRMADIYGEGEIVVNSEHRRGVQKVARGFVVSARALDGVIEAIESESNNWFAMGIQWQPASETASGLDIQVFRGLVEAASKRRTTRTTPVRVHAA